MHATRNCSSLAIVLGILIIGLVVAPSLRAQGSDNIVIKDPAEFNAYQSAISQADPKSKAEALERFLQTYPQSPAKIGVLGMLIDSYVTTGDVDKDLSAAVRLHQADPNDLKAIYIEVFFKKSQCAKTGDAQTCAETATLAQQGLAATKPPELSEDNWKKQTDAVYPIFRSGIAIEEQQKEARQRFEAQQQEAMRQREEQARNEVISQAAAPASPPQAEPAAPATSQSSVPKPAPSAKQTTAANSKPASTEPAKSRALSSQAIVSLLQEGLSPARVATLVNERGVTFSLTGATEKQLKSAGADDALLVAIATHKKSQ